MRLGWLVALVASVAVIVGGIVGHVSNRRERADERDEGLRATTALSVAHVDAELARIASVLQAVTSAHTVADIAALLDGGTNVCSVTDSTICSTDEPSATDALLEEASARAQASSDVTFLTEPGDTTDGVVLVAVTTGASSTVVVQITTRELLAADVSLIPYQPLRTPRFVDQSVAPDRSSPATRDDRRVFALPVTTGFADGVRYVVASAPATPSLTVGQWAAFAVSLVVGGIGLMLSLVVLITHARRLSRRAATDDLTGLLTRREFEQRAAARLDASDPQHGDAAAVVFIDLDEFKRVNDRAGHHVGDAVLGAVAARLGEFAGDNDVIARWGGDEFVVLLVGADAPSAHQRARAIEASLRQVPSFDDGRISCSIGVAMFPEHGRNLTELMRSADVSMYHAKEASR